MSLLRNNIPILPITTCTTWYAFQSLYNRFKWWARRGCKMLWQLPMSIKTIIWRLCKVSWKRNVWGECWPVSAWGAKTMESSSLISERKTWLNIFMARGKLFIAIITKPLCTTLWSWEVVKCLICKLMGQGLWVF